MLTALLSLISTLAPVLSSASQIASVISTLENVIGLITKEVQSVVPEIKNIITALQSNGAVTEDQMTALKALDAATDAAFEEAAIAAGAEPDPNAP